MPQAEFCVGIHSPGEMGQAVARVLAAHGARPIAALEERSKRTRALAQDAGIEIVESLDALVEQAHLVLSILVPSRAVEAAWDLLGAMLRTQRFPIVADCNAISARTARGISLLYERANAAFIDVSIIGPPPRREGSTRFYASGPHAADVMRLNAYGLDVRFAGSQVGQASDLKSCYASLTKGFSALATQAFTAAQMLDVGVLLRAELELSQKELLGWILRNLPNMPPKAHRWVGEMEEHALAFSDVGLSGAPMRGSAELYRMVQDSPGGRRSPEENAAASLGLDETVAELAAHLQRNRR